jgi:uncharacterized protein (DUF433 family)
MVQDGSDGAVAPIVPRAGRMMIGLDSAMNYHDHIVRDPDICGGEPAIRGTRVTLRTVLGSLAEGCDEAEILRNFPALTPDDLKAVIAFAATSAEEDLPVAEVPRFDANPAQRESSERPG